MLYAPLCSKNYKNHVLPDTGAVQSAMPENEFRKIQTANPNALLNEHSTTELKIQIANGTLVTIKKQVVLKFFLAGRVFEEVFLNLLTMGAVLIGMSFFEKYSLTLDANNHLFHVPDVSIQVRRKSNNVYLNNFIGLEATEKTAIRMFQ